ncbi:sensor histidine kinase [Nitrosophilus alvini]|uniref:sensor histidine kinase n=1 Tax=Nitrosophilus alvini TaxID=2714855 RepID=UPI00190C0F5F|nr:HAMP domain-containing sensor histidine kinase [Nitrosophilus alvini]
MNAYEKKSLLNFLIIYVGSTILLLGLVAWFFYKYEEQTLKSLKEAHMRSFASMAASAVIRAQMQNEHLKLPENKNFKLLLLDSEKKDILNGKKYDEIDVTKNLYTKNGRYIYIDKSAYGHLGVKYIAVLEKKNDSRIEKLQKNILLIFLGVFLFISVIAYFLGRMFLKPVKEKVESIEKFAKESAHELNTPVTALLMSAKQLENSDIDQKILKRIRASTKRIKQLYDGLSYLFLSEHEPAEKKEINLKDTVTDSIGFIKDIADTKRVTIISDLENCRVFMDEKSAFGLVGNIISNAVKYTPPGKKIEIILKKCRLVVKDEGRGIPESKINDIFKRYVRIDKSQGGFGIGLSIVKEICEKYDIKIDVHSTSEGTSFILTFPENI